MASLFTSGRYQGFDSAGVPLSGGLLYSYAAGTLTPLATYTTQSGGVANANPVVLDSAGRAPVWLSSSSYRMILKTAAGVTVTDDDNISPYPGETVTFAPSGTGAVATTVQAKLRESVSAFDFMTAAQVADVQAGTIALDVSAAVQAAITHVKARGGGAVFFPFGRYRCDTTIKLQNTTASNAHVSLIGEGGGNAFIPNTATGSIIVGNTGGIALDCAGSSSVTLRDIGVMCGGTLTNQSTIGILFQRTATGTTCQEVVMENVSVGMTSNPAANGGLGTIALANKRGEHWNCTHLKLYANIPLLMDGGSNYAGIVSPDYAEHTAAGTTLTLLNFEDCLFLSSTGDAVVMTSAGGVTFNACYWYAPVTFSGLNVKFCYNLTVSGQIEGGASNFIKIIGNSNNFFCTLQAPTPGTMVGILGSGANLNGFDLNFRGGFGDILSGQFFGGTVTYDSSTGHTLNLTGGSAGIVTVGGTAAPANAFIGGVNFGNAAIVDPFAMDWYEEGTFTPVIVGTGTAGTGTYTYQAGRFQRVGNRVNFSVSLIWTAHTGTTNMQINGLPYASASINASMVWACNATYSSLVIGAGKELSAIVNNASSSVSLYAQDQAGGAISLLPIDAAGTLYVSGSYEV